MDALTFAVIVLAPDEVEDAFVTSLSAKQRKRLIKKLKKQSRDDHSSSDSDSDSDSASCRHRSKKKKSSKHKHKRKHKHRSRNRSNDDSEGRRGTMAASRHRDVSLSPRQCRHHSSSRRSRSRSRV